MAHILVFGHSIAQGYWDTQGGWVQRLRTHLDERYLEKHESQYDGHYYEVYDLGVSGEDTGEVLNRFEDEASPRLKGRDDTIIIHIGKNDIHRLPNGSYRKEVDEFRQELAELVSKAKRKVDNVLVVGEGYVGDIEYSPGSEKKVRDSRLQKFEEVKKDISEQEKIPYVDLRDIYTRDEWKEKLEDGFHPDNEGHEKIFQKVKEKLAQENVI